MEDDKFPIIPADLMTALNKKFPERSPEKNETEKDLYWRGGQRSVIRVLNDLYERQNENITTRRIL